MISAKIKIDTAGCSQIGPPDWLQPAVYEGRESKLIYF